MIRALFHKAMSTRTELARRVLQILSRGDLVPTHHALQLRSWALTQEDAMLSLEEIASRILIREENHSAAG
jgi:adenylate kinase family enzyme